MPVLYTTFVVTFKERRHVVIVFRASSGLQCSEEEPGFDTIIGPSGRHSRWYAMHVTSQLVVPSCNL